MKLWKPPHISKIYEALSAIADKRIEVISVEEARCTSTSRGKYYTITYDPQSNSVMSNDNTAYYTDKLSYPIIAFLMLKDIIKYDVSLLAPLKDIPWKDINQKFHDDYDLGLDYYFQNLFPKNQSISTFKQKIESIYIFTSNLTLQHLGKKKLPPKAY
ncbi:hypothetical protein KBD75_00280 [Candidatus Woesebacteria bacterium]|nr:hypothetical protein [Candidatus Woesebacteria bacterium]